jgi:hypothetical protein
MNWKYWIVGLILIIGLACTWPMTSAAQPPSTSGAQKTSLVLVGLGGTRGILTEVLWWRINDLQRQGRNAEVYPLTQLLTELDPTSPNVAVFNAGNCAYNIACTYDNVDDRWTWMKRGHKILAETLERYPNDKNALREMMAFWQLKFHGNIDPYQDIFHQRVAEIPLENQVRKTLEAQHLPLDPNLADLRLYAWAHHANAIQEELFALQQLLNIFHHSPIIHRAFANAYQTACRDGQLTNTEARHYQSMASERLKRFPNDPYLTAILKELP